MPPHHGPLFSFSVTVSVFSVTTFVGACWSESRRDGDVAPSSVCTVVVEEVRVELHPEIGAIRATSNIEETVREDRGVMFMGYGVPQE